MIENRSKKMMFHKLSQIFKWISILLCVLWGIIVAYSIFSGFYISDSLSLFLKYNVLSIIAFSGTYGVFSDIAEGRSEKNVIIIDLKEALRQRSHNELKGSKKETVYIFLFQICRVIFVTLCILMFVLYALVIKYHESEFLHTLSIYHVVMFFGFYGICYLLLKKLNINC